MPCLCEPVHASRVEGEYKNDALQPLHLWRNSQLSPIPLAVSLRSVNQSPSDMQSRCFSNTAFVLGPRVSKTTSSTFKAVILLPYSSLGPLDIRSIDFLIQTFVGLICLAQVLRYSTDPLWEPSLMWVMVLGRFFC